MVYLCVYLHAILPRLPQVTPCEEAGHCMPAEMMNPALLPQLGHDGINEWISRPGLADETIYSTGQALSLSLSLSHASAFQCDEEQFTRVEVKYDTFISIYKKEE